MAAQKFHKLSCVSLSLLFLISFGCSAGNVLFDSNNADIVIDNSVDKCLQIKPIKKVIHNNVTFLDAEISQIKSVGYCGCKSALLSYYVLLNPVEKSKQAKEYHVFSSLRQGLYTFVVGRDYTPNEDKSYRLNIQCASSD